MSTRSVKRINISESENIDNNSELETVRKTRSKKHKENCDEMTKIKKKRNYVRRPSVNEKENSNEKTELPAKSVRKSRRQTLKNLNVIDLESELPNDKKSMRQSRRIRKEDIAPLVTELVHQEEIVTSKEKKKSKKTKPVASDNFENGLEAIVVQKKKATKKKNKNSNSFIVEDLVREEGYISFNKSNASIDSFHSAAGSLTNNTLDSEENGCSEEKRRDKEVCSSTSTYNCTGNDKLSKKKTTKLSILKKSFECSDNKIGADKAINEISFYEKPSEILKIKTKKKKTKENVFSHLVNTNPDGIMYVDSKPLEQQMLDDPSGQNMRPSSKKSDVIDNDSFDFINDIPQEIGIISNNKEELTPCKTTKQIRKSTCRISTIDKTKTSSTVLNVPYSKRDLANNQTASASELRLTDVVNTTFDKINLSDININSSDKGTVNTTTDKPPLNNSRTSKRNINIKNSPNDNCENKSLNLNTTYDYERPSDVIKESLKISLEKNDISKVLNATYDKNTENNSALNNILNSTFDKPKLDSTFECSDGKTYVNLRSTSSIISSDTTNMTSDMSKDSSRISITSDDSRSEHIINTTPVLIESSMDDTEINSSTLSKTITPLKDEPIELKSTPDKLFLGENKEPPIREGTITVLHRTPLKRHGSFTEESKPEAVNSTSTTPLKREGTFTKDSPAMSPNIAHKTCRRKSMPSPGRTPATKIGSKEPNVLNITHSIEKPKRRSPAAAEAPRLTKVMFCSPVDTPAAATLRKGKLIKSNMKGSNKSFIFDDNSTTVCESGSVSRKRSRTQGCDPGAVKRARLTNGGPQGRTRTASAAARLQEPGTFKQDATPSKVKPGRTKLPNFSALHQKNFEKMESLDECQERKAKRAKQLLTPNASTHGDKTSPKETTSAVQQIEKSETPKPKDAHKKTQTYTRFGFKLNLDVNPFSIPPKPTTKPNDSISKREALDRQATLPSLAGNTLRKEVAKMSVMREKSFADKRNSMRNENRTVIKGVRTNRRFELQMKMRNIK